MSNIAKTYLADGQIKKALALHEETLKLRREQLGADHPSTLTSMSNIAKTYLADGQIKNRLHCMKRRSN